jgi:hypothetical protein
MLYPKKTRDQIKDLPEFDENAKYTPEQLELYATKLLLTQRNQYGIDTDGPQWLLPEQFRYRYRREILNKNGVPDPGLYSGIYFRAHPKGRKLSSKDARENQAASFYA